MNSIWFSCTASATNPLVLGLLLVNIVRTVSWTIEEDVADEKFDIQIYKKMNKVISRDQTWKISCKDLGNVDIVILVGKEIYEGSNKKRISLLKSWNHIKDSGQLLVPNLVQALMIRMQEVEVPWRIARDWPRQRRLAHRRITKHGLTLRGRPNEHSCT